MPSFSSPDSNRSMESSSIFKSPQLRKEHLRTVKESAQALQGDLNVRTIERLEDMINGVDVISKETPMEEKVRDQAEVILDSEIMNLSSQVLRKCTFTLNKTISTYDPNEFAGKVKSFMSRSPDAVLDDPNWPQLGMDVIKYFKRTAAFTMLLGSMCPIAKKERIVKPRAPREAAAPTKRPENIISAEKSEENDVEQADRIRKIIGEYQRQHNDQPLDFFSLVLHPTDFGKTIENMLHVSFLIRDARIQFLVDADGIPHVAKLPKDAEKSKENKKKRNVQNVVTLTMQQWSDLVDAYQVEEPMIDFSKGGSNRKK
ncbi:hypothetical protein QAD02_022249 [Eretmocerus hayati]|uniref:Uncharacterized protein n=1 Tax=Eretmocerus hayati TaxID=131215 RepID=A0ACC2PS75_9HYME|nr:hypothetical protein QAD02_022249 [Eretmocerus hayati]